MVSPEEPIAQGRQDALQELVLALLKDAHVEISDHGEVVRLERSMGIRGETASGSFYFKVYPLPSSDRIRSEVEVLSTLQDAISYVPHLYDFGSGPVFYSQTLPRSGVAMMGTSVVEGDPLTESTTELRLDIISRIAEIHRLLAVQPNLQNSVEQQTDYQRLLFLFLEHKPFFDRARLTSQIEALLDRGVKDRPLVPIHADLRHENVIARKGTIRGLIDFSDARRSFREDELGRLFQYLMYSCGAPPSDLAVLFAQYEESSGYTCSYRNLALSVGYNTTFRCFHDSRESSAEATSKCRFILDHLLSAPSDSDWLR